MLTEITTYSFNRFYSNENKEILGGSSQSVFFVFKNVTKPFKCGFLLCDYGNGTLESYHFNYNQAVDSIIQSNQKNTSTVKNNTKTIFQLISENFLNEERFAEAIVSGKFHIKRWGKRKIISYLKQNEVSEKNISNTIKTIDNQEYTEVIRKLVLQKSNSISETDLFKRKTKIIQYMVQKGYENDLVWEEIEDLIV